MTGHWRILSYVSVVLKYDEHNSDIPGPVFIKCTRRILYKRQTVQVQYSQTL